MTNPVPPQGGSGTAKPQELTQQAQQPIARPQFPKPTAESLRHKFAYHAPTGDKAQRHEAVRETCLAAAMTIVDLTPSCPEQTRAVNAIQEAMMLANAAIALNP